MTPAPNRIGVILGVPLGVSAEQAAHIKEQLEAHFPSIVLAVVPGANSIAFEFYDPYPREDERDTVRPR